jgi:hypothetical protein
MVERRIITWTGISWSVFSEGQNLQELFSNDGALRPWHINAGGRASTPSLTTVEQQRKIDQCGCGEREEARTASSTASAKSASQYECYE